MGLSFYETTKHNATFYRCGMIKIPPFSKNIDLNVAALTVDDDVYVSERFSSGTLKA
jgi:hypothetical protein